MDSTSIAADAMAELELWIEATLREMILVAGRTDCWLCRGAGVIVKRTQSWRGSKCTLDAHIRRCTCVDVTSELRRRLKDLR